MQNTRLNTLVDSRLQQLGRWLQNPWRRLSLQIISLLLGNFLASVISTSTGQRAYLDVIASLIVVTLVELMSWLVYGSEAGRRRAREQNAIADEMRPRPLWLEMLNDFKLGLIYGLFLEAFKLGS
jgi:hypothetical protein